MSETCSGDVIGPKLLEQDARVNFELTGLHARKGNMRTSVH